jgi:hypothetical protein
MKAKLLSFACFFFHQLALRLSAAAGVGSAAATSNRAREAPAASNIHRQSSKFIHAVDAGFTTATVTPPLRRRINP